MPQLSGLLALVTLAITVWCYWRILGKAGRGGWWALLLLLPLIAVMVAGEANLFVLRIALYGVSAAMIWIFAFMRWPSFETAEGAEGDNRYMPPERKPLDAMPSADPHRNVNPRLADAAREKQRRRSKGK